MFSQYSKYVDSLTCFRLGSEEDHNFWISAIILSWEFSLIQNKTKKVFLCFFNHNKSNKHKPFTLTLEQSHGWKMWGWGNMEHCGHISRRSTVRSNSLLINHN